MNVPQRRALMVTALLVLIGITLSALIGTLIGPDRAGPRVSPQPSSSHLQGR